MKIAILLLVYLSSLVASNPNDLFFINQIASILIIKEVDLLPRSFTNMNKQTRLAGLKNEFKNYDWSVNICGISRSSFDKVGIERARYPWPRVILSKK
jgi:hypothetical protein